MDIFTNSGCSGTAAAGGTAAQFTTLGIQVAVASDATTAISARARNADGDTSACSNSIAYVEDSTPPETAIDSGPTDPTNDPTPSFAFHASEAGFKLECRFDSASFAPCSGPGATHTSPAALPDGSHTFEVRSVDEAATPTRLRLLSASASIPRRRRQRSSGIRRPGSGR